MLIIIKKLLSSIPRLFRLKITVILVLISLGIAPVVIMLFSFKEKSMQLNNNGIITNGKTLGVTDILELTYLPWSDDLECSDLFVQFIRNRSHPPMALASYPGSGNTWIRGLIERLTGYFTGSALYLDNALYVKGKFL